MGVFEIERRWSFEAAHALPCVPAGHKCAAMHGHSYTVAVTVQGPLDPDRGWVMDFADLDRVGHPVIGRLDHQVLNTIQGLENPTSENVARWLLEQLLPELPGVRSVTVHETSRSGATYRVG